MFKFLLATIFGGFACSIIKNVRFDVGSLDVIQKKIPKMWRTKSSSTIPQNEDRHR